MDKVLRSFAEAKYSDAFTRQFLQKVLSNLSEADLSAEATNELFRLFLEWILVSDSPILVEFGHKYLGTLSECNPELFHAFVSPNLVIEIFNDAAKANKVELVRTVGQILDLLKELPSAGGAVPAGQHRTVVNVTKAHLFNFLRDQGIHLSVAAAISGVYQSHPEVLPNQSEWPKLAVLVVKLLAGYRLDTSSVEDGAVATATETFFSEAQEVSMMLPLVWGRSEATDGVEECLKAFYVIISTEESYSKPSCALVSVIDKIPRRFLNLSTKAILEESGQQQGEAKTVIGLQTMIEWLTQHPGSTTLSEWIQQMLHGLQKNDKNSVLIEIAHSTTEKLLLALSDSRLRPSVEPILFFLLLGFQHSESVFHSVVSHLPRSLRSLKKQDSSSALLTLGRLGESAHFLMRRFPNFPELYNPVEEALAEVQVGPPTEARSSELKTLSWLSPIHSTTFANDQEGAVMGKGGRKRPRSYSLVDETLSYRSETGMVGLINLGNTCYMNSVLQSLFMSKDFCEEVLQAPLTSSQNVLFRLQQAFAFLKLSQRSIYSPAEFLKAARPPWFEPGRQQDCSEFLRFLLDTLHEQEKTGAGGKAAVTYGEHKVIESTQPLPSVTTSAPMESDDEAKNAPVSVVAPTVASAKVSSASNLALDVISEAPENDDDDRAAAAAAADEDEEMMSQDGRMEEDHFGSRGSLTATPASGLQQQQQQQQSQRVGAEGSGAGSRVALNLDDDEDVDLAGSRTSLGSGGLKRWTTEENLSSSVSGSREGSKVDLLEGPLHDSHSNSTDSGIQSVGDSIRGSSDSMGSNPQPMDTTIPPKGAEGAPQKPQNSSPFVSLVQQVFGGKMQTSYTCLTCRSVSLHRDIFTELHLAIPEISLKANEKSKKTSASKEEKSPAATPVSGCAPPPEAAAVTSEKKETGTKSSVVDQKATAKDEKTESDSCEAKTPTLLLPPLSELVPKNSEKTALPSPLTMESLVTTYLQSEMLQGDNKYHCDKCAGLRDAEKTIKILEGPQYLICTLLRFKYDRTVNRKSKVFTDVDYQLDLELPVHPGGEVAAATGGESSSRKERYSLYAVVVHSGYSSDGGHYYTYAREPLSEKSGGEGGNSNGGEGEAEEEEATWYIFNDSKVSFSTFESFKNVSKRFPRDAAYQLFYRKTFGREAASQGQRQATPSPETASPSRRPLRHDLKMAVEKDNLKFLREKERSASKSSSSSSGSSPLWQQNRRWDDDGSGGGGGGGGGCGGGGFNSPGRLVC